LADKVLDQHAVRHAAPSRGQHREHAIGQRWQDADHKVRTAEGG
jgi:hypothetical protein